MRLHKIIVLVIGICSLSLFMSCEKPVESGYETKMPQSFFLAFVNSNGDNLLNQSTFGGVKLYYMIDGIPKEVLNRGGSARRGMTMNKVETGAFQGQQVLRLLINDQEKSNITNTLVKWTVGEERTIDIRTEYLNLEESTAIMRIWMDGQLIWETGNQEGWGTLDKPIVVVI